MEKSKLLGEAGALITTHAKKGEYEEFGKAVDNTSEAVCQLTEAAAQVSVCHVSVCLSVCLFFCLSVSVYVYVCLSVCLSVCLYMFLSQYYMVPIITVLIWLL